MNNTTIPDKRKRILIFIVAYNAEKTISDVLTRIKLNKEKYNVEILVIDDASDDLTFKKALQAAEKLIGYEVTILRNPRNHGYGGNQKLGYRYAINHGFDLVALLHGDGQYAPECLEQLAEPVLDGEADAVLGSRMLIKGDARRGGMPLYKVIGNKILTGIQNRLLKTKFSEFHSGYRVYSVSTLKSLPFEYNSNEFHFDTQIIIQLIAGGKRIEERPIPTYYGDEICYVKGIPYAWNVVKSTLLYRLHKMGIFYQFNYDVPTKMSPYTPKLDYLSPHSLAVKLIKEKSTVFDLGCGPYPGMAEKLIRQKKCTVYGLDDTRPYNPKVYKKFFHQDLENQPLPDSIAEADYILLLDVLEHLKKPEEFLIHLRERCQMDATIIISVPNVAFLPVRLMLMLGKFNYGRAGILDKTHLRLFTYASFKTILKRCSFVIKRIRGIPPPYEKAIKKKWLAKMVFGINRGFIRIKKRMFSYQFFTQIQPLPVIQDMLKETISSSREKRKKMVN